MSYEDLTEARAKRTEKEANKAARKTRGRKRKGGKQQVGMQETASEGPLAATAQSVMVAQSEYVAGPITPCPGAAPVARMLINLCLSCAGPLNLRLYSTVQHKYLQPYQQQQGR